MTGWIKIIGVGVGDDDQITPEAQSALENATDAIGYTPYIERIAEISHLKAHSSDNRHELERATQAISLAQQGHKVALISSGDPGVFAMASAFFEELEKIDESARGGLDIEILPGISAMFAAAAKLGAPLGHDFCAINLSTHLKSWEVLEKRLRMAARGDFVMAFYNPRSKTRPDDFAQVLQILREECKHDPLIIFARNVTRTDETLTVKKLSEANNEDADMRTLVILGNSQTRQISGTNWVYSPRSASS